MDVRGCCCYSRDLLDMEVNKMNGKYSPSVNTLALAILMDLRTNAKNLRLQVEKFENGAVAIDASQGDYNVGARVGEICMGGLGTVSITTMPVDGLYLPAVHVHTGDPVISCMGSQYAGWQVKVKNVETGKKWKAMSSGPARARSKVEKKLYARIGYEDEAQAAVTVFETSKAPTDEVMEYVAGKCNVDPKDTHAIWAPTNCIVGSTQISARVVETSIHKLFEVAHEEGYQIEDKIVAGEGIAPIAPIAKNDLKAMGRTNDAILAGGNVNLTVRVPKDEEEILQSIMKKVPSSTAAGYGDPFYKIFKSFNFKFYDIDPGLFAPALVTVNNMVTGSCISYGALDPELLKRSFFTA
ncbi:methenyltetrahydromethanopterin cyclohydrolase [Candidatus Bathyarchaeota archaeon]|nr:methenyltetrahydromethanopterin cyclohydrolase [Candidatus Bathyarchaeota archaeon]